MCTAKNCPLKRRTVAAAEAAAAAVVVHGIQPPIAMTVLAWVSWQLRMGEL